MAKEITREELKPTLRHYWRMRKAAFNFIDKYDEVDPVLMANTIGESWYGKDCFLCQKHYSRDLELQGVNDKQCCRHCPLKENSFCCLYEFSIWNIMNDSDSWTELISSLTTMARIIMKLPRARVTCPDCNGHGTEQCGHQSHHIETMSNCDISDCENGWITCKTCNGEGAINAR
jgi:hypothetical protein